MRISIFHLLLFLAISYKTTGQKMTISPVMSFTLSTKPNCKPVSEGIHGISGIEYIIQQKEWILVGDCSDNDPDCAKQLNNVFRLDSLFQIIEYWRVPKNSFEAIRYDSISKNYFYSIENTARKNTTESSVKYSKNLPFNENDTEFIPKKSYLDNNGIEGFAISNSYLWAVLERGDNDYEQTGTLSIKRYSRDSISRNFLMKSDTAFTYKIDDWDKCCDVEKIGISELLALDDNRLLILERCFAKIGSTPRVAFARIRQGDIDHVNKTIDSKTIFTFPDKSVDNMEGMTWWVNPMTKHRMLAVISDDNPQWKINCQKTIITLFDVSE